jgi:hypothetical protein
MADALHPDDKGKTIATLEEAGRKCSYWEAEYRLRHKNGGYVWLLDRGCSLAAVIIRLCSRSV